MKKFKVVLLTLIAFTSCLIGVNLPTFSHLSAQTISPVEPISATSSPSYKDASFDLRDYIDIKVENQNPFGTCYAFASLTCVETYLALNFNEYYDFSEMHFATAVSLVNNYYPSIDDALNEGGNFTQFVLYTQKDYSLVLEEEMPLSNYKNLSISSREEELTKDFNNINSNFYSIAKVDDTTSFQSYAGNKSKYSASELTTFRNSVKNHIVNHGSLAAGIHTKTATFDSNKNLKVTNDSLVYNNSILDADLVTAYTDHMISIIGWDDNYDANGSWSNKGAYLCQNSWGTSWGNNGCFYVSYDDYFIESSINGVYKASLSTTNSKISSILNNQEKTNLHTHRFTESRPTVYTANIFDVSSHLGENITHIDSFITGSSTKFYIKFFDSFNDALNGINGVTELISTADLGTFSVYTKHQLPTPLKISKNYIVVVREILETHKIFTLAGNTSDNLNIPTTYYYQWKGVGHFDISTNIWDPWKNNKDLDCTIPLTLYTDKPYISVSNFSSNKESLINSKYIKNNATFAQKTVTLNFTNTNFNSSILDNISITKLYSNSTTNVTSNFTINVVSATSLSFTLTTNLNSGNYIISIIYNETKISRVIEVEQNVVSYLITYNLDGGQANNPSYYTNQTTILNLNTPIKNGYEFVGWFTDENLTQEFNPSNLPYTDFNLYAKYDFALPTILNKSSNISITYYKDLSKTISVSATHHLLNEFNTLTYQWYKCTNLNEPFTIVEGATSNSLTINNVNQSGYYSCEVSITFTDTSLTNTPCTKTISADKNNTISVNIKPYIYDTSNIRWNYSNAISYDTQTHTVQLINLPDGVTANYTNNSNSNIGTYIASAELVYDDMHGNAIASEIDDLHWEIRKAKITITINNITSENELSITELENRYSCTIENEYLPSNIISLQDKLEYLNLKYTLTDTYQPNVKIISATTNAFDIYEIEIKSAQYRIVLFELVSNNISSVSQKGFVKDCKFTAEIISLNDQQSKLLTNKNLQLIQSYNLTHSYLDNDQVTISIPVERQQMLNNLSVYILKDNKLVKLKTSITDKGISFVTSEQNGVYVLVQNDYSNTTNTQMLILIVIISTFVGMAIFIIFKRTHKKF